MAIAFRNAERFMEKEGSSRDRRVAARVTASKPAVLLTGAPGWLGTRLAEVLIQGLPGVSRLVEPTFTGVVRCLVRPSIDPAPLPEISETIEIAPGDLTDAASLEAFCDGADGATLFHVAGLIHPARRTRDFHLVNVDGTRNLLRAAEAAGVKRVVVVSSNSPIGCNPNPDHRFDETSPYDPYMGYGRSKAEMEALVADTQARGRLETVVIRPPWFYGPHQPPRQTLFFTMIKEGRFPVLGSGEQQRSMAYVDNICQGLLLAATVDAANGQTYWIADERPYSVNEIVATVREVLESFGIACATRQLRLPSLVGDVAWIVDAALQGIGLYHQKFHVLGEMNKNIACSVAKAERDLGYAPTHALRDGMQCSVRWCLANGQQI